MSEETTKFIAELTRQEAAPKTIANYQSDLLCFRRWFSQTVGEDFSPAAVTPTDVRDYKSHLLNVQRCRPATINRRLATLRRYFQWAKLQGFITGLPTDAIKGVQSQAVAPKWLEKRESDRLIRAAEKDGNKRNLAILQLLRNTGLRVGELCALRLDDIEISERKGKLVVRSSKGNKHREIPLNLDARQALSGYLSARPAVETDHLFVGQRGEGLKPQAVENVVRKHARLAGLENTTPHTLRHSFAKQALDAGVNLVTVARLMGHARLDTTAIYTQPGQNDLEQAVEKLEIK